MGVPLAHQDLARRARSAEDRLFPLAMTDSQRYQWAVLLVSVVAGDLRVCSPGWDDLASGLAQARSRLAEHAAGAGVPRAALDADLVVDAALSQRIRELIALDEARRRSDAVAAARQAGRAWVVVEEPDPAALVLGAGQWVEIHVASGAVLQRWLAADAGTGRPEYGVRLVAEDQVLFEETSADPSAWQASLAAARAAADGTSAQTEG